MNFGKFYLDKEKDIIIELSMDGGELSYTLRTPNHAKGNLITNLARLCGLKLSDGDDGLKVIRGAVPCYVDERNREVYVLRLAGTKVANIYPDGTIERKAYIPAISKTLMSQTKDYSLDIKKTLVKTYIRREYKFRTDLHTHMNANLDADVLIALGIFHQIRYPLYYIKKLGLRLTGSQRETLEKQREGVAEKYKDCGLEGKYLTRKIDDNTFINFAGFILNNLENAEYNIPKIRASLTILKDGQAVFTNLEKVYIYRYVFAKGQPCGEKISLDNYTKIPDSDISSAVGQMIADSKTPEYKSLTLFQNKLLWIARGAKKRGVSYMEISDTTLVKPEGAAEMLGLVHEIMPKITAETGVVIRFLAAIRRIPLTIIRQNAAAREDIQQQLGVIDAIACDPYVAGSDIIGEEINDVRDLRRVLSKLVEISGRHKGFVIRVHAGENDGLRDNVANSLACIKQALPQNAEMPSVRIGHGLYTANLRSERGKQLIDDLRQNNVTLEFQLTSNVRLNNLSSLENHPLKLYLKGGVSCVQGTDGGAIYGTDSIDEQLALERLLDLNYEEMTQMKQSEEKVLQKSIITFAEKTESFKKTLGGKSPVEFYKNRIAKTAQGGGEIFIAPQKIESETYLKDQIREIPADKVPVILLGGSFNSGNRSQRKKSELCRLLSSLAATLDPEKACFVIGSRLTMYERYLVDIAKNKFEIFAIVPTRITQAEASRLKKSGISIRVSIEPTRMGLYKSFAYEIFKRRPSVVIALDGNSAGANTIQEAKNGKKEARIFVYRRAGTLYAKARAIQGYVSVIEDDKSVESIMQSVKKVYSQMKALDSQVNL